jgi:membrane-associated phospholipid phosphatase
MNKRQELYPTIARTSPALFFYLTVLNCIISPSYNSFYLFIVYFCSLISNLILKNIIVKPIYNLFNKNSLPLLGIGSRPKNAESCHLVLDNIVSVSYGMPSGHSQLAWAVATYILYKIITKWYTNYKYNKDISICGYLWLILSCIIVLVCALYISYSRVYIEGCHTLQQVIVGGGIGIIFGLLTGYFENYLTNVMSKLY